MRWSNPEGLLAHLFHDNFTHSSYLNISFTTLIFLPNIN